MIGTKLKKLQRVELNRRIEQGDEKAQGVLNAAKERQREQRRRFNEEKIRKRKQSEEIDLRAIDSEDERQSVATGAVANNCAGPSEANDGEDLFEPVANLTENTDSDALISSMGNPISETDFEHEAIMSFREFYHREVAYLEDDDIERDAAIEAGLEVVRKLLG